MGNGYRQTSGVWNGGNFNAATGLNNSLTGTVAGLEPSGLQIYVEGDGGGHDSANTVNVGVTTTCKIQVLGICTVANTPATQGLILYAPTSKVTVNTGACVIAGVCAAGAFGGALVGDDLTVTAAAIYQDLDIANFPLSEGTNALRPVQYIQCDTSVTTLTQSISADTAGC